MIGAVSAGAYVVAIYLSRYLRENMKSQQRYFDHWVWGGRGSGKLIFPSRRATPFSQYGQVGPSPAAGAF